MELNQQKEKPFDDVNIVMESVPLNSDLNIKFRRLPTTKPIELSFHDLSYTVSVGFRRRKKEILHHINGRFLPSQLIAIMGPSGAGKSTLLDLLSGYRLTGVKGDVFINDNIRNLQEFRRESCYLQQEDRLQPLLTTHENMVAAADLKLPSSVSKEEKLKIIDEILSTLQLKACAHTNTGQLSGGQKKRLSIALELVNNPVMMFLDEPTTGLDSSTCMQCLQLLKLLALQGRTIICTIHQPSARLFQLFDHVYVLSAGNCIYQGSSENLVPYLQSVELPCPKYHNPADHIIELACGEYGEDSITTLVNGTENGENLKWFQNGDKLEKTNKKVLNVKGESRNFLKKKVKGSLQPTTQWNQINVLLKRGFIKAKRDQTLTYLRILVNIVVGIMIGSVFWKCGNEGSKILDNYNLLFSYIIHMGMSTKVLATLTFPMEMTILTKEYFNRWYSLKSYYISTIILEIPILVFCTFIFQIIIYLFTDQPLELFRFNMCFAISLLVVFISQSIGFMIGIVFNITNGTFIAPTIEVGMMMFSGFGVSLRDLPSYLKWGSDFSYLRYSLEGIVASIYGFDRKTLPCKDGLFQYCHYRSVKKFLDAVGVEAYKYWNDLYILIAIFMLLRISSYFLLRWRIYSIR